MRANDDELGADEELDEITETLITTLAEIRAEIRRIRRELLEDGREEAEGSPG
ncbi:MAG TPA: hypothetical protein VMV08_05855 [Gaiellaceae bacterium]|nr:hypothetical protein [Gaiellaceae bacterium]